MPSPDTFSQIQVSNESEKDRLMMRLKVRNCDGIIHNRGLNGNDNLGSTTCTVNTASVEMQTSENSELRDKYLNETESVACA